MIPDEMIDVAARWLAEQHWEPMDDRCNVGTAGLREIRQERIMRSFEEVTDRGGPDERIGMSVPCRPGRDEAGLTTIATVEIFTANPSEWCVFGYLPGEVRPGFIRPIDLDIAFRARWAVRDVREEAAAKG
jgi:hypothetical protein